MRFTATVLLRTLFLAVTDRDVVAVRALEAGLGLVPVGLDATVFFTLRGGLAVDVFGLALVVVFFTAIFDGI